MEHDFPRIVREARKRQSTLLFEDEAGVHEDGPLGTTWGLKGETPVAQVTGTRRRTNVISALSPRGRLWFRSYRGRLNARGFIGFLKALLHDFSKPIDLILDRHPAHVAASRRPKAQVEREAAVAASAGRRTHARSLELSNPFKAWRTRALRYPRLRRPVLAPCRRGARSESEE